MISFWNSANSHATSCTVTSLTPQICQLSTKTEWKTKTFKPLAGVACEHAKFQLPVVSLLFHCADVLKPLVASNVLLHLLKTQSRKHHELLPLKWNKTNVPTRPDNILISLSILKILLNMVCTVKQIGQYCRLNHMQVCRLIRKSNNVQVV